MEDCFPKDTLRNRSENNKTIIVIITVMITWKQTSYRNSSEYCIKLNTIGTT